MRASSFSMWRGPSTISTTTGTSCDTRPGVLAHDRAIGLQAHDALEYHRALQVLVASRLDDPLVEGLGAVVRQVRQVDPAQDLLGFQLHGVLHARAEDCRSHDPRTRTASRPAKRLRKTFVTRGAARRRPSSTGRWMLVPRTWKSRSSNPAAEAHPAGPGVESPRGGRARVAQQPPRGTRAGTIPRRWSRTRREGRLPPRRRSRPPTQRARTGNGRSRRRTSRRPRDRYGHAAARQSLPPREGRSVLIHGVSRLGRWLWQFDRRTGPAGCRPRRRQRDRIASSWRSSGFPAARPSPTFASRS